MEKRYYECSHPTCGCEEGCAAEDANDRLDGICEECELPKNSKAHLEHCPEAIRG